jgi:pimeloyl-ACP methyl ester carboxylesterase
MPRTNNAIFYQLYFQEPGVAEAELERDTNATMRKLLFGASGDAPRGAPGAAGGSPGMMLRQGGLLGTAPAPRTLPAWLTQDDVAFYAAEFKRTGLRGGLNWYRNIDRNWELLAPWADAKIQVPALYIAGDRDLVVRFPGMDRLLPALSKFVPNLRASIMLPGCGHWTQQERPDEVNAAMIDFLKTSEP